MAQSQISSVPTERYDVLFERTGEPFRYPPLRPESVRFVNLYPSQKGTDALSCSFLHLPRSAFADTKYEVLSGFWGSPAPFQPVSLLVDGRSCKTTPKLAQALFRFRLRDKSRLLWIQSLCIDSFNLDGRNRQIGGLRDVLQSARRLIVWLGGVEDNSDYVFQHLSQFKHLVTEKNWPDSPPDDTLPHFGRHEMPYRPIPASAYEFVRPYPETAETAFAHHLCLRPWFYRPWSIPELHLSKNIQLVCGEDELELAPWYNPIAMLVDAYRAGHYRPTNSSRSYFFTNMESLPIPAVDAVSHVSSLSFHPRPPPPPQAWRLNYLEFETAYRIVRNCLANDRRDSVFAIATLQSITCKSVVCTCAKCTCRTVKLDIDYSLSVSEVYQQATLALMRKHCSIQVLRRLDSLSRDFDLPSWTLDFGTSLKTGQCYPLWALPGVRLIKERETHLPNIELADASRETLVWPLDAQNLPETRVESGKLFITGLFLETITAIGPVMPVSTSTPTSNSNSTSNMEEEEEEEEIDQDTLTAWAQLASSLLHPTGNENGKRFPQSVVDAFFDTIMANDTNDVLRNNPPRPTVSPVADIAKRWYLRHYSGDSALHQLDPEYFAESSLPAQGTSTTNDAFQCRDYELAQIWGNLRLRTRTKKTQGEKEKDKHERLVESLLETATRRIARACTNRRFFITNKGSMGLAPPQAEEGDAIVFLPTGVFPLFLQPQHYNHNQNQNQNQNQSQKDIVAQQDGNGNTNTNRDRITYKLLGEGFLYDWWQHVALVFEHRVRTRSYGDFMTDFILV